MNHAHQIYRARRDAVLQSMRARSGGGLALVPDRARSRAQSRLALSVPARQLFLLPVRISGARGGRSRSSPVRTATGTCCSAASKQRGARDLGRLSLRPRRRARNLRLRRGAPDRRAATRSCRTWPRDRPALFTPLGLFATGTDGSRDLLNEVRNRVRTGVVGARRGRRRARSARRDAPRQGRARDRADAPRRRDLQRRRTGARWARTRPGWYEYQVEAELLHEFLRDGAQAVAYPLDRRVGPECVRAALSRQQPADERRRPAADRRRLRIPGLRVRHHAHVSGRTAGSAGRRRTIYELVLAAQLACIDAVKPGAPFHDYHQVAERVLAQGFIDLGLCSGHARRRAGERQLQAVLHAPRRALARHGRARRRPVPGERRVACSLAPGMVLTVEPGAYIRPADNVPEAFWNIGVRIEDDVLVTAERHRQPDGRDAEIGRRRRSRLRGTDVDTPRGAVVRTGPR